MNDIKICLKEEDWKRFIESWNRVMFRLKELGLKELYDMAVGIRQFVVASEIICEKEGCHSFNDDLNEVDYDDVY